VLEKAFEIQKSVNKKQTSLNAQIPMQHYSIQHLVKRVMLNPNSKLSQNLTNSQSQQQLSNFDSLTDGSVPLFSSHTHSTSPFLFLSVP